MPNIICDKCSELHETRQHDIDKLKAIDFLRKYYGKTPSNCSSWLEFAEAYAKAKRYGLPDVPEFVSHRR